MYKKYMYVPRNVHFKRLKWVYSLVANLWKENGYIYIYLQQDMSVDVHLTLNKDLYPLNQKSAY